MGGTSWALSAVAVALIATTAIVLQPTRAPAPSTCKGAAPAPGGEVFPCGFPGPGAAANASATLAVFSPITPEEAAERRCCITLPCEFEHGCWSEQTPPLYSAPRDQALTRAEANRVAQELLLPRTKELVKTHSPDLPDYEWYRVNMPRYGAFHFVYDAIQASFRRTFAAELLLAVDLDFFVVTDFTADKWANDETYRDGRIPGAAYWIHNDCDNFRICYAETGLPASAFTGNGVAFVLPVLLPSDVDYRDGHTRMPAGLELYNVSHGHTGEDGEEMKPWNREWMDAHLYNLGEIIYFNAFRYHSGHVPRTSMFVAEENPMPLRSESVGFAGELKNGSWILYRMCKGSTDDGVKEKMLATDFNPISKPAAKL